MIGRSPLACRVTNIGLTPNAEQDMALSSPYKPCNNYMLVENPMTVHLFEYGALWVVTNGVTAELRN